MEVEQLRLEDQFSSIYKEDLLSFYDLLERGIMYCV